MNKNETGAVVSGLQSLTRYTETWIGLNNAHSGEWVKFADVERLFSAAFVAWEAEAKLGQTYKEMAWAAAGSASPAAATLTDERIDQIARPFAGLGGVEDYRAFATAIEREVLAHAGVGAKEPIARLMHWTGQKSQTPHDGICARTFSEFAKGAGEKGGYWREGELLYLAAPSRDDVRNAARALFEECERGAAPYKVEHALNELESDGITIGVEPRFLRAIFSASGLIPAAAQSVSDAKQDSEAGE